MLLAFMAAIAACGGSKPAPTRVAAPKPTQSPYQLACQAASAKRAAEVQHQRYLPPELMVHRWPGKKKADKAPRIAPEKDLVAMLRDAQNRATLIIARGGTGKSKLAWSLEAQLCGELPTARVDLNWDVAAKVDNLAGNPVLAVAARKLGGPGGADSDKWLRGEVGDKPWLLILDSLDEVPLGARVDIVDAVNKALAAFPALRAVMMTRPPVYTGNYGLKHLTTFVELPQLSCARTDKAIEEIIHDPAERAATRKFAARFGLGRKARTKDGRCYYPHMATYRDLFVLRRIATSRARKAASALDATALTNSRARVYEFYLSVLLVKDMQGVTVLPKVALEVIDKMVAASNPGAGDRNVSFGAADCTKVMPGANDADKGARCERLLQSSLLKADGGGAKRWRLRNQSLYDLFLARWTDGRIAAAGASPCKPVRDGAALFESNEVAGFLVGLPGGQRCLVAIADELCRRSGFAEHNFEQLDQGLPAGPTRKKIISDAEDAAGDDAPEGMCVGAILDRLHARARTSKTGKTGAKKAE